MKYQFDTKAELKEKLEYAKWSLDNQNPHSIKKTHSQSEIRARQAEVKHLQFLLNTRNF